MNTRVFSRKMTNTTTKKITNSVLVNVRVARKLSDLKLGYRTWLTIIHDKKSNSTGSRNRHLPLGKSFSSTHMMKSVSDATKAAAEGMGKPTNSRPLPPGGVDSTLNRARRKAPQIR